MPQVIFRYKRWLVTRRHLNDEKIEALGEEAGLLIAEALNVAMSSIEWLPEPYHPKAVINDSDVLIEIRTVGSPERKRRLTVERLEELKREVLKCKHFPIRIDADTPLLRVRFEDPDGWDV